jgi:hypothetical protein
MNTSGVKLPVCGKLNIKSALESNVNMKFLMGGYVISKVSIKKAPQIVELFNFLLLT